MTAILPAPRLTGPSQPDHRRRSGHPAWVHVLDAAMSGGVAAFALWTLIYEVGLGLRLPVGVLTVVWLVAALPLAFLVGRAGYRETISAHDRTSCTAEVPPEEGRDSTPAVRPRPPHRRSPGVRLWPAALSAICAAVLLSFATNWPFWSGWALAIAALVRLAVDLRRPTTRGPDGPDGPDGRDGRDQRASDNPAVRSSARRSPRWHPIAVLVTGLLLGVGTLFGYRPSPDDAYYLNLSTWVAERDHFPLRDTMFSDQAFPTSYGGGFPISSIEGLIGGLARLVHLSAPTMAYFVLAPVLGFASVWVLGQLARLWTPRHALWVFAISAFFVLVGRGSAYRAYSIYEIWQGKSAAIAILLPLIWIYATRIAGSRRGHWVLMLGLAGIAFIGLTSTAAILGPAIGCALLLAAVLLRNGRIAAGALALMVAPLLGGAAVALLSQSVGGVHPRARLPWQALRHAYGSTAAALALLTMVAVLLAPMLLRDRAPRALAWAAAAATVLMLTPGVFALGNLLTSAGPVEWRLLLVPPVPTLIGTLAVAAVSWCRSAAKQHRRLRAATTAVTVAAALVALSVADGAPPWRAHVRLSSAPVWKVKQPALDNVKALIATDPPRGRTILMPQEEMIVLSIYTVEWHGVAPRSLYIASLQEPSPLRSARKILVQLASGRYPRPAPGTVKEALHRLDVGTVCLSPGNHSGQASVRAAGFQPFAGVGTLRCAVRGGPGDPVGKSGVR